MADYRLSNQAAQDLEEIFLWGVERFGISQAELYAEELVTRLDQIATHPERWQAVDWIRPGYRRCVHESHVIYYKADGQQSVLIVRILGRQDTGSAL